MKVLVSFSGGKDSQACLIRACEDFGAPNVSRDDAQLDLFDDDSAVSCMSVYHGLCE